MNFENIVIFLPNDNRVLNFVPNVINSYTFIEENLQIVRRSPLTFMCLHLIGNMVYDSGYCSCTLTFEENINIGDQTNNHAPIESIV